MRLIFVRHGHPNYENDCLTELGHEHAAAAALRLQNEGISEIHASSSGRAAQTAQHTADLLGLAVVTHDFIREIGWGAWDRKTDLPFHGNPWFVADQMVRDGQSVTAPDWRSRSPFAENIVCQYVDKVAKGMDEWLSKLGYEREGEYYRVSGRDTKRTVAMFSHGGSSSAALSHMLNLPFPFICESVCPDFTAITILTLPDEIGELASPKIELLNDSRHIRSQGILYGR